MRYLLSCLVLLLAGPAAEADDVALLPHVATNDDLMAVKSTAYTTVVRDGFATPGDGGSATYTASNVACPLNAGAGDNGSQVMAIDGGCWLASFVGAPLFEQFGADPTGVSDSASQVLACLTYVSTHGGGVCAKRAPSTIRIATNIAAPAASGFQCGLERPGNPGLDWATSPYANLGAIKIAGTATITYNSMFVVKNCLVYRDGMTFPAADASAYAGTPFSAAGGGANDVAFRDVLIMGFATSLNHGGGNRLRMDGFYADGVNCAVIGGSLDTSVFRHGHCYPFGSVAASAGTCPAGACTRTGTGWNFATGSSDDTDLDDLLAFGYATCVRFNTNGNLRIGKIWADNCATVGVTFQGSIDRVTADDIRVYSNGATGVSFGASVGRVQIANMNVTGTTSGACVDVSGGVLQIGNLTVDTCASWGVALNSTVPKVGMRNFDAQVWGGSSAPCPIGIAAGVTTDNFDASKVNFTHDASVICMVGGNQLQQPSVAIAANNIPLTISTSPAYIVSSAAGTANTMTGAVGGRVVILTATNAGLVLTHNAVCSGSVFVNKTGANIVTAAGGTYTYIWDGNSGGCWRQSA